MRNESDWILRNWQRIVFKIVFYTKPFLFLFQLLNFYEIVRVFHLIRGDQCNNSTLKIVYLTLKKSSNWLDLQHLINIFNQKNGLSNLIYLSVIKFFRNWLLTFICQDFQLVLQILQRLFNKGHLDFYAK